MTSKLIARPRSAIIAIAVLSLPVTAALAQFNGSPRRPRPSPSAPASAPEPAPAPAQIPPAASPPSRDDFALPPPPMSVPSSAQAPALQPAPVPPKVATLPVEPPLRLGRGDMILHFRTDDASASISQVTYSGQPSKVRGLGSSHVEVLLKADPEEGYGTPCDTEDFVVTLANGVIWRPMTNFCNSGHVVSVPSARPAAPGPLPTAPREFSWQFDRAGEDGMLAYGIPQTDLTVFLATCRKGSSRIDTRFVAEAGPKPRLDLHGPDNLLRYDLTPNEPQSDEEPKTNGADLSSGDPLWALLRQGLNLPYRVGDRPFALFDTGAGRTRISQFVAWCAGA